MLNPERYGKHILLAFSIVNFAMNINCTAQKLNFSNKDFFSKQDEIQNFIIGKLHFLCSAGHVRQV